MNYQKMQNNYLQNQVMSASPNKLIEMLLQAAIKNIYMYDQLVSANVQKEAAPAETVVPLLSELLESWQTITQ